MSRTIIDLSMPVHNNMVTFPRVVRPALLMYENWEEFAERIGAAKYGVTWLTASYAIMTGDHVGTHIDSLKHLRKEGPGAEGIPIEYCYGDGVVLDFSYKPFGSAITADEVEAALKKIGHTLKPLDIVLIHTGAGKINHSDDYLRNHCGMGADATLYLINHGIKVMGIDAVTWDIPVWAMFETKRFWESHRLMIDHEYYHLENMMNLDQLLDKPFGFTVSVLPVKWVGTTAAPVRAIAVREG